MAHVLVISDTHLRLEQADHLIGRIRQHLQVADAILHAGDITDIGVLGALGEFAPVHAVLGNNDFGVRLPVQRVVGIGGCEIGMIHDSGSSTSRSRHLHRLFPSADVVVFGHSHAPWNETDVRISDGHVQHHLNPGSAVQRRMQLHCTIAWLDVDDGVVGSIRHAIV